MILIVCTDDPQLTRIAERSIQHSPGVFGNFYKIYNDNIPVLGLNENLYIIAHGAYKGDENVPVIGDKQNDFYLTALDLIDNINNIFPVNYNANIFVDACESADHNAYTFSFIDVFQAQIQVNFSNTWVYGRNGSNGGLIPPPYDRSWRRATY